MFPLMATVRTSPFALICSVVPSMLTLQGILLGMLHPEFGDARLKKLYPEKFGHLAPDNVVALLPKGSD